MTTVDVGALYMDPLSKVAISSHKSADALEVLVYCELDAQFKHRSVLEITARVDDCGVCLRCGSDRPISRSASLASKGE